MEIEKILIDEYTILLTKNKYPNVGFGVFHSNGGFNVFTKDFNDFTLKDFLNNKSLENLFYLINDADSHSSFSGKIINNKVVEWTDVEELSQSWFGYSKTKYLLGLTGFMLNKIGVENIDTSFFKITQTEIYFNKKIGSKTKSFLTGNSLTLNETTNDFNWTTYSNEKFRIDISPYKYYILNDSDYKKMQYHELWDVWMFNQLAVYLYSIKFSKELIEEKLFKEASDYLDSELLLFFSI